MEGRSWIEHYLADEPQEFTGITNFRRLGKRGKPCCTKFTSIFAKCCCHWLDHNHSQFDFKNTKNFRSQAGDNWTCNGCSKGYICPSDNV